VTGRSRHLYQFLIAALVVVADRSTKWLIARSIPLNGLGIEVIPRLFRITHVENRGAAFGLFAESTSPWKVSALVMLSLAAMAVIVYLLWKSEEELNSTAIGLSLILGGAAGNFWDRIVQGRVVDFLHFYVGAYTWPDFNVADSCIVIGATLLMADIIFSKPYPTVRAKG
jgi:signal peptidase II